MMINRYDNISENILNIKQEIQKVCDENAINFSDINIMAVTKTVPAEYVNVAIENGITLLGENRVQEFLSKKDDYTLNSDSVHFIGHLQTNKVKHIVSEVSMIESVSSLKLAKEIDKCCKALSKTMDILLQVNIGKEESKSGFYVQEIKEALLQISKMENIKVKGLMCIPPKVDAEKYFIQIHELFIDIRERKTDNICMEYLSMGMSGDYSTAVKHGANIVRVGSAIFGKR